MVAALAAIAALSHPVLGIWALAGGLAMVTMLHAEGRAVPWLSGLSGGSSRGRHGLVLAALVGSVLGVVNLGLARAAQSSSGAASSTDSLLAGALGAVRAGITEELGVRGCLLAVCLAALGRLPQHRSEWALTYLVLVVPHAAMHFIGAGPGELLTGTLVLGALFGMPLSWLLLRHGLATAMLAHVIVDLCRVLDVASSSV